MRDFKDTVRAFVEPIRQRVLLMLGRAVISAVNDTGGIQLLKMDLLADETRDVERYGAYGFTSNPPVGSEAIVAFLGGNRAQGVVIGIEDRTVRLKNLATGDVAMYTGTSCYAKLVKVGNEYHLKVDKLKLEGETDELLDLVKQVAQKTQEVVETLSTDTTNTIFGPMKLNHFATYETKATELQDLADRIAAITAG